jgi:hypothetical protein
MSKSLISKVKKAGTLCVGEYFYTYVKDTLDFIIKVPKEQQKTYDFRYPELINNQVVWVA